MLALFFTVLVYLAPNILMMFSNFYKWVGLDLREEWGRCLCTGEDPHPEVAKLYPEDYRQLGDALYKDRWSDGHGPALRSGMTGPEYYRWVKNHP
tara:strand:- start:204 stop:488 length:285 start_codon:yes stop_codon:yes gene_type:complete